MLSVDESYSYAARLTRSRATNFYYAFRFLPPERRRSIFAVYAFSRRADDAVDSVEKGGTTEEGARAQLEQFRSFLGQSPPDDPLVPALKHTVERYAIPREPFEDLLAGMEMDLVKKSYATFDELLLYCYRAASVVGLISIEIFGHRGSEARGPAVKLGLGMQITNILRDVEEDRARGRVYLPIEDMNRFGYTVEDLNRGVADDRFKGLMKLELARAREYFREAVPLFPLVDAESRYCPILLMRFYERILDRIERQDYDVLHKRPRLPLHEKLLIAAKVWFEKRRL